MNILVSLIKWTDICILITKHWYAIPVTLSQCSTGVSFLGFYRISRWNYCKAILIWLKLICNYKDRSFYSLSIIKTDFYWSRGHHFTICLLHQVNIESQPTGKVTQMLSILRFSWSNGDKLYYIHRHSSNYFLPLWFVL